MTGNLPARFAYLRPAAHRFGDRAWDGRQVDQLARDGEAVSQLAAAHAQIVRAEDDFALSAWLDASGANGHADGNGHSDARRVRRLLDLLAELGRLGVRPFADRLVQYHAGRDAAPDWSALPAEWSHLIGPARKYGPFGRPGRARQFVANVTEQQFNELADTADRIGRRRDATALRHWLTHRPPATHPEAALIDGMLRLIDALDIF